MQTNKVIAKDEHDTVRLHTDFPTIDKEKKLEQAIFYVSNTPFHGTLRMDCYRFKSEKDSQLVYSKKNLPVAIKEGANQLRVRFGNIDTNTSCVKEYLEVLKRTGCIAPGEYRTTITITDTNSQTQFVSSFVQLADSTLKHGSPLRGDVNKSLTPKSKSFLGLRLKNNVDKVKGYGTGSAIANADKKIGKAARSRGLRHVSYEANGKSYINFYYEDWFAGRYEAPHNKSLAQHLKQEESKSGAENMNGMVANDLTNHPSMFSQFKTASKQKQDNQEMQGEISLSTNVSNGQEPYSGLSNNYYELRGRVELPICNLPVELEGLYTSQDQNRSIKSSYFHLHYDVGKSKDEMTKMISSYNQKFSETQSKSAGMEQIYQKAINNMEGQKAQLEGELKAQEGGKGGSSTGGLEKQFVDTAGLKKGVAGNAGPEPGVPDTKNVVGDAAQDTAKLNAKRRLIENLEKRIAKYEFLLAQNRNTNYFDSTMGYSKTKNLNYSDQTSYRQLTKSGENLLPDGSAKKFATGITSFDAGMFSKTESKYTMSGQMMKGADFGYDLGLFETGISAGKTQYIGRDGTMDKYTCYSGKVFLKSFHRQKIGFIYYGYSPDRNMLAGDAFFSNANVSGPSFFQPVSIVSTNYTGSISKCVAVNGEAATTISKTPLQEGQTAPTSGDKMAWHLSTDANIPNTPVKIVASYDKTGKDFVNNTLPISLSGTEQYKVSVNSDLFHAFLTAGIEYDYLTQSSFASSGSATKWGFSIKTHSKRYPTVAVSYKPFTTFRAYTDTLGIPQRPLLGSVWTSKASYKFRKDGKTYIFSLLYNKSMTSMDTATYGSTLLQGMCTYTEQKATVSATVGYMNQTGANTSTIVTAPPSMDFFSINASYNLSKTYTITGGQDIGFASFGFCRYSINSGMVCNFKKKPVALRLNLRYSTFELNSGEKWANLYSGNIELGYRFKSKVTKKSNF